MVSQVPGAGVFQEILILASMGDSTVVKLEAGGGYCPRDDGRKMRRAKMDAQPSAIEES
jgi:hypothetical protein